jgi:TPR repeat protein
MNYLLSVLILFFASKTAISAQQIEDNSPASLGKCAVIDSLEKEASKGNSYAIYLLATNYDTILNRLLCNNRYQAPSCGSHPSAIYWYTKAANNGEVAMMVNLASHYDWLQMLDSANYWFQRAYQKGDNSGLLELYGYSKLKLVPKSKRLNFKSLFKYIENRSLRNSVLAMELGSAYEFGRYGIKKDLSKALYWYKVAQNLGDESIHYSVERLEAIIRKN